VGQAALYGVYLDDSEYDYTQHLRPMGNQGAVFIEAPSRERKEKKTSVQVIVWRYNQSVYLLIYSCRRLKMIHH
jgi:hypothetical protein